MPSGCRSESLAWDVSTRAAWLVASTSPVAVPVRSMRLPTGITVRPATATSRPSSSERRRTTPAASTRSRACASRATRSKTTSGGALAATAALMRAMTACSAVRAASERVSVRAKTPIAAIEPAASSHMPQLNELVSTVIPACCR